MKVITMCHFNRPKYTRESLEHLSRCKGIEDYLVICSVDPGDDEVQALVESVDFAECMPLLNQERLGCDLNTLQALLAGFRVSEYVIHVEDDVLLGSDSLLFFEFCRQAYLDDPEVFTACAWTQNHEPSEDHHGVAKRRCFHPWGWATWRDRFAEMASYWGGASSWDIRVDKGHRGDRYEVHPVLSRAQNIGIERATNLPDAAWHRRYQHTEYWTGNLPVPEGSFHE